jgi:hypothetical protein
MRKNRGMYVAVAVRLRDGDRGRLEAITGVSTAPAGVARRARVVLLAADGVPNTEIADRLGMSGRRSRCGGAEGPLDSCGGAGRGR